MPKLTPEQVESVRGFRGFAGGIDPNELTATQQRTVLTTAEWSTRVPAQGNSMHDGPDWSYCHKACPICGGMHPDTSLSCYIKEAIGHRPNCPLR